MNSIRRTLVVIIIGATVLVFRMPAGGSAEENRIPFAAPGSHAAGWATIHGSYAAMARGGGMQRESECLTCHLREDCLSCHTTREPRSHSAFFRTRSHGWLASGDPTRCLTCHRQDTCVRCHNETAPRSHRGNWASDHCTQCHYATGIVPSDECKVCHRIAPH